MTQNTAKTQDFLTGAFGSAAQDISTHKKAALESSGTFLGLEGMTYAAMKSGLLTSPSSSWLCAGLMAGVVAVDYYWRRQKKDAGQNNLFGKAAAIATGITGIAAAADPNLMTAMASGSFAFVSVLDALAQNVFVNTDKHAPKL